MLNKAFSRIINKKILLEYSVEYEKEAGLVLTSDEVKALRKSGPSLNSAYCFINKEEIFIKNLNISNAYNSEREKKLLLHKKEIFKIIGMFSKKCYIIAPLEIYETRGLFKVKIGLCKHLKKHDRRDLLKQKDIQKEIKMHF